MLLKLKGIDPHQRQIALRPEDIREVMEPHPAAAEQHGWDPAKCCCVVVDVAYGMEEDGMRYIVVEGSFNEIVREINAQLTINEVGGRQR